jgi:nucleotide-binding universal stress UspA family protein
MFKKVLVPLDGSGLAECALSHVKDMAKDGSLGEVILLNIAIIDLPYEYFAEGFDFSKIWDTQLEKSKKYLADVQTRLEQEGIKCRTEVIQSGWPARIITEFAQYNGVDLIVIATHGHSGMKRLMFGSVALSILHDSHVPVLLIRPESCRA